MRNFIPWVTLMLWAFVLTWGFLLDGDPRMVDRELSGAEMRFEEKCLTAAVLFFTFATVFVSARRAYLSRSKFWLTVVIFVWPLSIFYALFIKPRHEGSES